MLGYRYDQLPNQADLTLSQWSKASLIVLTPYFYGAGSIERQK